MFGLTPDQLNLINNIVCTIMVLAVIIFAITVNRSSTPKYKKPVATKRRAGVIEVTGDVHYLQSKMHRVVGGGTWTHTGTYKWVYTNGVLNNEDTDYVVNAINSDT